jgi:predicted lipoprotein with Yx(FWY)xxD motif
MSRIEDAVRGGARWIAPIAAVLTLGAVASAALAVMAKPTTVTTHKTKRGKDLAALSGHTLYLFSTDTRTKSTCNGACARTWKPLLTSSRPVAASGSGVNSRLLGTLRRADHTLQVTYNHHPLYLFSGDRSAGQINGEGANKFGGHWYIVNTSGNAVKPSSAHVCHGLCQGY